jgi:hypothetical protein
MTNTSYSRGYYIFKQENKFTSSWFTFALVKLI